MYTYVICVVGWWLLMFGSGDLLPLLGIIIIYDVDHY